MNKFEKLIEYIINDEDQKARELFHTIVVEKSRDIYENIMQQEEVEEEGYVRGAQVKDLTNELADEESVQEDGDEEEGEEFSLDGDADQDGAPDGEFGAAPNHDMDGDVDGNPAEQDIEAKVSDIDTKMDELLAKFDSIMGEKEDGMEEPMDMEQPMGEPGMEQPMGEPGMEDESRMFEAEEEEEKEEKEEEESKKPDFLKKKTEESARPQVARTATELMREYAEKIQDMNLIGDSEGTAVGTGAKTGRTNVNTKYTGQQTGPDFGGKVVKTDTREQNQDGKTPTKANNEYNKGQTINPLAKKNVNTVPGKAGKAPVTTGHEYTKDAKGAEGQTTDGSVPVAKKSVQVQNTGKK
jgi:hypothetical protein